MNRGREIILERLLAKVEAGERPAREPDDIEDDCPVPAGLMLAAFDGRLDAAEALHKAVLLGWGWRIGTCWLSDDAFVFPDYNCPVHGARMKRDFDQLPDGSEWADLTDIDQRPAGNVARAWLRSILTAKLLIEQAAGEKND